MAEIDLKFIKRNAKKTRIGNVIKDNKKPVKKATKTTKKK